MIVKCLNCANIYERRSEEEKCCDKCVCIKECPNCGSNAYAPVEQKESKEVKKQILHD